MYGTEEQKKLAAAQAVKEIENGMALGLGTGSTVYYLLLLLAERIRDGLDIHAVATSVKTEELAVRHGIPLIPANQADVIHLAIDGVDFIDPDFYSIKGGGGALFREKVIASQARRVIWIMDESKPVDSLNGRMLPIETAPFACEYVKAQVRALGFEARIRRVGGLPEDNLPAYITDNGNYILDLKGNASVDYCATAGKLKSLTGVLETGLFDHFCEKIIVGTAQGVVERRNPHFIPHALLI